MKSHIRFAVSLVGGLSLLALPSLALASYDTSLSIGARGSAVVSLQQFLISQNLLAAGNDTGYFGKLTLAAVKAFQTVFAPPSDGIVGPKTWLALHS